MSVSATSRFKAPSVLSKKKKRGAKDDSLGSPSTPKMSKITEDVENKVVDVAVQKSLKPELTYKAMTYEEITEKYPILKDEELIKKFLAVPMNNNQKGRIRQNLRDTLKNSDDNLLPEIIHSRIKTILSTTDCLTDSDLRKIRILHNMLKTTSTKHIQKESELIPSAKKTKKNEKKQQKVEVLNESSKEADVEGVGGDADDAGEGDDVQIKKTDKTQSQKVKGTKRYVAFLGNLPNDVDKDMIMRHFSELTAYVTDVRIPTRSEGKGGIAYIEFNNESMYQLALSKHHTMLANRRINVSFTTTGKSKTDTSEAKGKAAKMVALQKSGKLLGSIPLNRKRSARRKREREFLAKANGNNE